MKGELHNLNSTIQCTFWYSEKQSVLGKEGNNHAAFLAVVHT